MQLKRREFVTLVSGAAAWPLAARAQRAMPVIGFLSSASLSAYAPFMSSFHSGLKEAGYAEGQNVAIEYRWAEGEYGRLRAMADELVRRQVSAIVVTGTPGTLAAKAATSTVPIVFVISDDPAARGLVTSLSRPGGNATGVNFFVGELASKQLGLMYELVPAAKRVGLLV